MLNLLVRIIFITAFIMVSISLLKTYLPINENDYKRLLQKDKLVVGVRTGPTSYYEIKNQKIGFTYDLVKELSQYLGVTLEIITIDNIEEAINDHTVFNKIVTDLLTQHFADTQFEDILDACGISLYSGFVIKRSKRDPEFRQSVLDAYGHKCAICDYDIQFRTKIIGVEAAHIQWHNAQGPDIVSNGVALCAIHHKLLDYGAIGFNDDLELVAAHGLHGSRAQLDNLIYDYVGHQISLPRNRIEEPSVEYVRWQRKEIFKGN